MAVCGVCGREKARMHDETARCARGIGPGLTDNALTCYRLGYSRAIAERDDAEIALANVSGALVDAATIRVPEPAQYGNAVRMLSAERDEAVGLLRDVLRIGYGTVSSIRAFLAKHPEAG